MRRSQWLRASGHLVLPVILAGCAKHYAGRGMVLEVDAARRQVIVSHDRIEGLMDAMAMPFEVSRPELLNGLKPGSLIDFRLAVRNESSRIDRLTERGTQQVEGAPTRRVPEPGDRIPDFELLNQDAQPVRLTALRGKVVAIDFIYTRCPLPEVCPRLSANFARLQRRFAGRSDFALLSITLDPVYDRPEALARYARIWRADTSRWQFLTGSEKDIRGVAEQLGVAYWNEEGQVVHSTEIAVLRRDGTLAALIRDSRHPVRQLGDLIERELKQ